MSDGVARQDASRAAARESTREPHLYSHLYSRSDGAWPPPSLSLSQSQIIISLVEGFIGSSKIWRRTLVKIALDGWLTGGKKVNNVNSFPKILMNLDVEHTSCIVGFGFVFLLRRDLVSS